MPSAPAATTAVIATKFGMLPPPDGADRRSPAWVATCRRRQPAPARYRPHRPLPDPPARPRDADRRHARGARTRWSRRARCARSGARTSAPSSSTRRPPPRPSAALRPFVTVQNEYSLAAERDPEADVIATCERHGMTLTPYFPLASGLLTGKYRRGEAPAAGTRLAGMPADRVDRFLGGRRMDVVERLTEFAPRARPHAARARVVVAGGQPDRPERDRGGDEARAGPRQRAATTAWTALRRGARRGRRAHTPLNARVSAARGSSAGTGRVAELGGAGSAGRLLALAAAGRRVRPRAAHRSHVR